MPKKNLKKKLIKAENKNKINSNKKNKIKFLEKLFKSQKSRSFVIANSKEIFFKLAILLDELTRQIFEDIYTTFLKNTHCVKYFMFLTTQLTVL